MTRKVCLLAIANDFLPILASRLPKDVWVAGKQEWFDRAITTVRMEGSGLPDWCAEPAFGQKYAWGAVIVGGDGVTRILPAQPVQAQPQAKSDFQRIQDSFFNNPN
jgi:hypothetical protein